MMARPSLQSVLMTLIPMAVAASLIGFVLNGYSRELDGLLGACLRAYTYRQAGPDAPAASGLPSILDRVADSLSTADLARLLAEQLAPSDGPDPAGGIKRACYAFLIARKYKKETLVAYFFDRTPFAVARNSSVPGFARAAHAYFGVSPEQMTTGEAILLFHLARFPDAPLPVNDPERALELRNNLLRKLFDDRLITRAQYRSESSRPLILSGSHPAVW